MADLRERFVLFIFLTFLLSACSNTAGKTALPKTVAPSVADTTATSTTSPSPNITATDSLAPTLSPTFTPTATVVPIVQVLVVAEYGVVREGPDEVYDKLGTVSQGVKLEATGRSTDGDWVLVRLGLTGEGWISISLLEPGGDYETLPVIEAPSTPTPSPTPEAVPKVLTNAPLYARNQSIKIALSDFAPREEVKITIENIALGGREKWTRLVRSVITNTSGFATTEVNPIPVYPTQILPLIPGIYRVTAEGDKGSYAETTIEVVESLSFIGLPKNGYIGA